MKRILKKSVAVVSLLMTMAAAYAQMDTTGVVMSDEMGNVVALSLDEAKNHAVAHNRTIKNAALDVKKAEAERWKAIASMLLQVSGEVDYNNMFNHKMSMGAMDISMPSYFEFDITPSFTVSGSQILGVKLANVSKEMSEIAINKTDQSITSNIETSYVGILAQQKTVDLLEKNLANLDSVYKMTLNAVKVGAAEQNDADQISIQVASLKSNVNNLNRMIEVMYNSIRLLTGIPADVDIVLTQPLEEVVNPGSILEIMGTELDMDRNYDYQLQAKMVELNEKQVKLKKMAYVPTLTAYYNFDKKKYLTDDPTMDMTPPHMFGVRVNVPIYSSGSRLADVRSAKYDYEKAQNQLEDTRQQLGINEKQLRFNLVNAFENHQIQSDNIEVMQRVFKSNSEKFKYGTISSQQLTQSSIDLITAQNTYISALTDMVSAYVDLKVLLNK